MKTSYYFSELFSAYDAEINDLMTDSEGKLAIHNRLKEKRKEFKSILPMIEFSPEMVLPVFYDCFSFSTPKAMASAVMCEPDDGDFPSWDDLSSIIKLESWAHPLVDAVLNESAGDVFMVSAACVEFIRKFDSSARQPASDDAEAKNEMSEDEDDDEDRDLAEAGDNWLGEQGFDSIKS